MFNIRLGKTAEINGKGRCTLTVCMEEQGGWWMQDKVAQGVGRGPGPGMLGREEREAALVSSQK